MKGRPTIILRFKQQVTPPAHPEPPSPSVSIRSRSDSSNSRSPERTQLSTYGRKTSKRKSSPLSSDSTASSTIAPVARSKKVKMEHSNVKGDMTSTSTSTSNSTSTAPETMRNSNSDRTSFTSTSSCATYTTSTSSTQLPMSLTGKRKRGDYPKSIGGGKGDLQPPKPKKARHSGDNTPEATPAPDNSTGARKLRSGEKKSEYEHWFQPGYGTENDDQILVEVNVPNINGTHKSPVVADPPAAAAPTTRPALTDLEKKELREAERVASARSKPIQTLDLEAIRQQKVTRSSAKTFKTDPLSDDLYLARHQPALKSEARARAKLDTSLHTNAVRLKSLLEKLHSKDWWKQIGLSNSLMKNTSMEELEERKKPLVAWVQADLAKYHAWNKFSSGGSLSGKKGEDAQSESEAELETEEDQQAEREVSESPSEPKRSTRSTSKVHKTAPKPKEIKPDMCATEKEFKSFFSSRSLRDRALNGRQREPLLAFGVPLPVEIQGEKDPRKDDSKVVTMDFELPEEFLEVKRRTKKA